MFMSIEQERRAVTIQIPESLKYGITGVEDLYNTVANSPRSSRYVFDMKGVTFIEPCGVIGLLSAARHCSALSGNRVIVVNLNEQLFPYLERMDLFKVGEPWLTPIGSVGERWSRSSCPVKLLELTRIAGPDDVEAVVERAERIFAPCLTEDELGSLLSVLSELCSNVFEHSYDLDGCALIQKYHSEQRHQSKVCLSVGDMGRGIRANLVARHGEFGGEHLDYIRAAMNGMTSRASGKGGTGIQRVRGIAAAHQGYVCLRSETAALSDHGHKIQPSRNLAFVAGTQVSVELRSAWED
jgi:hypothetical protein